MKPWLAVRVLFVFAAFLQGLFMEQVAPPPSDVPVPVLLVIFLFGIYGMLFGIGIRAANSLSSKIWRFPSWQSNPFLIKEPLQFFHFVGYYFLAIGVGVVLRQVLYLRYMGPDSFFFLAIASGLLIGIRVCTVIFYGKVNRGAKFRPASHAASSYPNAADAR
jgi:hypothetical protein